MYLSMNPGAALDLHHERSESLAQQAAAWRLAREAKAAKQERTGRWPRFAGRHRKNKTARVSLAS